MKLIRSSLLILGALASTGVFAQGRQPVPAPPPTPRTAPQPPAVAPVPPVSPPVARPFRYMAPMGMQARYTYEVIRTNRDELKVTDAQMKAIDAARAADDKAVQDRSMQKMTIRNELQDLADADNPDMAKIEAKVRELQKIQGDEMLADFKLTAAYRKALTADQRTRVKTLAPKFEPMIPTRPGVPMMPGMAVPPVPNVPGPGNPTPGARTMVVPAPVPAPPKAP